MKKLGLMLLALILCASILPYGVADRQKVPQAHQKKVWSSITR